MIAVSHPLYKIKYPKIVALIKAQTYKTQYFTQNNEFTIICKDNKKKRKHTLA